MLKILGLLAIMAAVSAIVYKVFFSFRKKHIGVGNIFYISQDGRFDEVLEADIFHQENLNILIARMNHNEVVKDGIIVHDFTNREQPFTHKVLVNGLPVGFLKESTAVALQQEKESLGIHSGLIYCKVKISKAPNNQLQAMLDLPPIKCFAKVLSNRSFEHSAEKSLKLK